MISVVTYEQTGKGKIRISFDNGMTLVVYRGEARAYHLSEDAVLEQEVYDKLLFETVGKRAKKRALYLLEQMDRTEKQLRDKLTANEYPQILIDEAIEYVKHFHYLDDYRYACTFVSYSQEKYSKGQMKQKLLQKGISSKIITSAIEENYQSDESAQIHKLLQKKNFNPNQTDSKEFQRIYQYILRRGFQSGDILRAMRYSG